MIRQEETIIFALIERAQFAHNAAVYQPSKDAWHHRVNDPLFNGEGASVLGYLLAETEKVAASQSRAVCTREYKLVAWVVGDIDNLIRDVCVNAGARQGASLPEPRGTRLLSEGA